jgi:putative intracellular protease/amidase
MWCLRLCRAEEIMAPILMFKEAGHEVSVISMAGGKVPLDEGSMTDQFRTKEVDSFLSGGVPIHCDHQRPQHTLMVAIHLVLFC